MFDLLCQTQPETQNTSLPPSLLTDFTDQDLPFSLTTTCLAASALMSGQAHPTVLERFATLAEAMQGAIVHAEDITSEDAPRILAILDREGRLVLAGATNDGGVAWCHPVLDAAEARAVVSEAPVWSIRSGASSRLAPCRSRRDARESEKGRGGFEPTRTREPWGSVPFPHSGVSYVQDRTHSGRADGAVQN